MKVICIDASPGRMTKRIPPFYEGEQLTATQGPHPLDYLIEEYPNTLGWDKKRFVPISTIDETTFKRNYNTKTV